MDVARGRHELRKANFSERANRSDYKKYPATPAHCEPSLQCDSAFLIFCLQLASPTCVQNRPKGLQQDGLGGIRSVGGHYRIVQCSNLLDFDFDMIPGAEEDRWMLRSSNTGGSSGKEQIAGMQRANLGNIRDEIIDGKDKLLRIGTLHRNSVEPGLNAKIVRFHQFIGRDEVGAKWTKSVERLTEQPLAPRFVFLPIPR